MTPLHGLIDTAAEDEQALFAFGAALLPGCCKEAICPSKSLPRDIVTPILFGRGRP